MAATTARLGLFGLPDVITSPLDKLFSKRGVAGRIKDPSALPESIRNDRTRYPDVEVMSHEIVETETCSKLRPVFERYLAQQGRVAFVGTSNFFYWVFKDPTQSVSPDVYIIEGIPQDIRPTQWAGSNDEQCWKTWLHQVVPAFALEVKAWSNPRKDELNSPLRHDALGTKELIVFDPFYRRRRRRSERTRFVIWRRNAEGRLVIVHRTDADRAHSETLDAYLLADGDADWALLRLATGPNGETVWPFEPERADNEAKRARQETERADVEAQLRREETRRADEQTRRADEQTRRADEATRRAADLEAELARLRASTGKRQKR